MYQEKRIKDTLSATLKSIGIDPDTLEAAVQDRTAWHTTLHKGATTYTELRTLATEQRRQQETP